MTHEEQIQESMDRVVRVRRCQEPFVSIYLGPDYPINTGSVNAATMSYREDLTLLALEYIHGHSHVR